MKKKLRILKKVKTQSASIKPCPLGGYCLNPACLLFGCIEK